MTNREVLHLLRVDWNSEDSPVLWDYDPPEMMRLCRMELEHPEKMDEEYDGRVITPDKMTEEMKRQKEERKRKYPIE